MAKVSRREHNQAVELDLGDSREGLPENADASVATEEAPRTRRGRPKKVQDPPKEPEKEKPVDDSVVEPGAVEASDTPVEVETEKESEKPVKPKARAQSAPKKRRFWFITRNR